MRWLFVFVAIVSCGAPDARPLESRGGRGGDQATGAVAALRASQFTQAGEQADAILVRDPNSSRAAAVRAIVTYQAAGHSLIHELGQIIEAADGLEFFDHQGGRAAWQAWLDKLAAVERDLAVAARDPDFSLELCIACWERDWNHNGEVDDRDRKLFELELDGKGGELASGDPRRRPTFRFDVGDVHWARAMIAFQRAFGELVLAYKWSDLDRLAQNENVPLVIHLTDRERVMRAKALVLDGLAHAETCRSAYLAETDDDREWVPNPRQHSHPMPLEVDDQLYATWAGVLGDVRRMLKSEEGISMREVARLADDNMQTRVPNAYVDIGRMFVEPKDIVIDTRMILGVAFGQHPDAAAVEKLLRELLGNGYQTQMKPSPLVGRLRAMKEQMQRGEDTFDRKLRYLFWLN